MCKKRFKWAKMAFYKLLGPQEMYRYWASWDGLKREVRVPTSLVKEFSQFQERLQVAEPPLGCHKRISECQQAWRLGHQ